MKNQELGLSISQEGGTKPCEKLQKYVGHTGFLPLYPPLCFAFSINPQPQILTIIGDGRRCPTRRSTHRPIHLPTCCQGIGTLAGWGDLGLFVQVSFEGPVTHLLRTYCSLSPRSHSHNFPVARIRQGTF